MNVLYIKKLLETYASKQGISRRYLKNERHVAQLNTFMINLDSTYVAKQDLLSPEDLITLVKIVINKKNRNGITASSVLFNELAYALGGYANLEHLANTKLFISENIVLYTTLCSRFPDNADIISSSLIALGNQLSSKSFGLVQATANKMYLVSSVLSFLKDAIKVAHKTDATSYYSIIFDLISYNCELDITQVFDVSHEQINYLATIFKYLISNKHYHALDNITIKKILPMHNLYYLKEFLSLLPSDTEILNCLLNANNKLETCIFGRKIAHTFYEENWSIKPYLDAILNSGNHSSYLSTAISKLSMMKLSDAGLNETILKVMIDYSEVSVVGCLTAITILNDCDNLLNITNVKIIGKFQLNSPYFAGILQLLTNARPKGLLTQENINQLSAYTLSSAEILAKLINLSKNNHLIQENIDQLLAHSYQDKVSTSSVDASLPERLLTPSGSGFFSISNQRIKHIPQQERVLSNSNDG